MRKFALLFGILYAFMLSLNIGCSNKKVKSADTSAANTTLTDTIHNIDTVAEIIEETPMPKAADQLFDDFFFNFIANKKLQRNRIKFPLPVTQNGKTTHIARNQWKTDKFFRPQGYYTLIFDDEKQADYSKSTKLDSVIVEKIHLKQALVEQYWFDHQDGIWEMSQIKKIGYEKSYNASFLKFLQQFLTHGEKKMIKTPLRYSGVDPNGEENTNVNITLSPEEWKNFLPEVPGDLIYNILYGQKYKKSNKKILVFRGLSNGVETQLVFERKGRSWRLAKVNAY